MNKNTKIIVGLALSLVLAVGVAFGVMWLIPADSTDKDNTSQTTASAVTEDAPAEKIEYDVPINTHTDVPDTTEPVETDAVTEENTSTEEDTESKPVEDKPTQTTKPATTTTATSKQPAVTVVTTTTQKTTPPSTVRTDRPVVTTTTHTTTSTADDEPEIEIEYDDDGFPDNPKPNQHYVDDNGQEWVYNAIFGWTEDGGDNVQYEFPDNYGPIGEGEQILS